MTSVVFSLVALEQATPLHQIPARASHFVGRERELAELEAAVDAGAPTMWITGPSGIGKTELAMALADRCRERGIETRWVHPKIEPVTPSLLESVADLDGSRRRSLLVIDGFSLLRAIEPWFVTRYLPNLGAHITLVIVDRGRPSAWGMRPNSVHVDLGAMSPADALLFLKRRGIEADRRTAIAEACERIPSLLVAASEDACRGRLEPIAGVTTRLLTRHDSESRRLAIAVLVAARTTPYELLEVALDAPQVAREIFAWLFRLSVVDHTPHGLRPHTTMRLACARDLAHYDPALWERARLAARVFTDHRIALAVDVERWLHDRIFIDRESTRVRAFAALPAGDDGLSSGRATTAEREEIESIALQEAGPSAAACIARWFGDTRTELDVVCASDGSVRGYACTFVLDATASCHDDRDPVVSAASRWLEERGWFDTSLSLDAHALVLRSWAAVGSHQAPSPVATRLLLRMAARVLVASAIDFVFIVTSECERWLELARVFALTTEVVAQLTIDGATSTVIAFGVRGRSIASYLHRSTMVEPSPPPVSAIPPPATVADAADQLANLLTERIAQLASAAALSPREQEVLELLMFGRNIAEIATALQITRRTARFHQANVLEKVGAESRLDLTRLLLHARW